MLTDYLNIALLWLGKSIECLLTDSFYGGCGLVMGAVWLSKGPCQTEFQFCRVLRMGGIKLLLLCGVRIEAVPHQGPTHNWI